MRTIEFRVGLGLAVASLSPAFGQCPLSFGTRIESVGVAQTGSSVAADLDQDGHVDAVIRTPFNATIPGVFVLWGRGDGTFEPPLRIRAGGTSSIALGDLNRDGRVDLVLSDTNTGRVSTMIRTAGRTFVELAGTSTTPIDGYGDLAVGDVNLDTNQDVVAMDRNASRILVFAGIGDGTFAAPTATAITMPAGNRLESIAVGDLNGDSRADCVAIESFAAGAGSRVHTLLGQSSGSVVLTFQESYTQPAGLVGLGDLDRDGRLDAVMNLSTGAVRRIAWLRGLGNGSLATAVLSPSSASQFGRPIVADLDGDLNPDVAAANNVGLIWLGNGLGGLTQAPVVIASGGGFGMHIADFAGDARPDLLIVGSGNGTPIVSVVPAEGPAPAVTALQNLTLVCAGGIGLPEVASVPATGVTFLWQVRQPNLTFATLAEGQAVQSNNAQTMGHAFDVTAARLRVVLDEACCTADASLVVRCVVTSPCGTATSPEITMRLCRIDMNCDAFVDFFDYDQFVQFFTEGVAAADFNRDGFLDFFDYDEFVEAFETGC